ncbi:MAG: DUF2309 domain-containing protein [Acidobacteria bacterium]|nr:DUF2309 domain-containing protein [Acidobacteriota bacterium]
MPHALVSTEEQVRWEAAIEEACRRVPPLWPLQNFVAVNPFLGLSDRPFEEAARLLGRTAHRAPLMDGAYYQQQIRKGLIASQDVRAALAGRRWGIDPTDPQLWLWDQLQHDVREERLLTVAEWLDEMRGGGWAAFVVDEISKWCSSYYDRGQGFWSMPWKHLPLYQAWKHAAELDANPEVFGIAGFRQHVRALPDTADEAIAGALERLAVPAAAARDFLHRELMSVFGWSAYAAFQDRQGPEHQALRGVLAIRLAYDTALLAVDSGWRCEITQRATDGAFSEAKYLAQLALEHGFRRRLSEQLRQGGRRPAARRKALQAVFCIDVRSEVYRRALEAESEEIETAGFAGFFGMPVEFADSARCPVLIEPKHRVQAAEKNTPAGRWARMGASIWKGMRHSPSASYSAIEVGGAWFGGHLMARLWGAPKKRAEVEDLRWEIPLAERVDLVAGALRNMSLEASRLAPVVLLCGHGSSTENNPYGSSLDCGACGGHKGDINARFAAALMNDAEVRQGLRKRGIVIPADTVFVAAMHITTTDEVVLFDGERLPGEQRVQLENWLQSATRRARKERSRTLPCGTAPDDELKREILRRSSDWSEVRPEWGLAGNAAFIAAPRWRTRNLDLGGRVFLHEYDPDADKDGSVLELILTAPVVVASWINLQYYGSTVNNALFGSGNKVLHNVVGTFGVWEGNGGDLRTGLPLQSLHDGEKWVHEPLRLQVFLDAPQERIDKVLRANPEIRALVKNEWIHVMAIGENNRGCVTIPK